MKKIILFFAVITLSFAHNIIDECDCGVGRHFDPVKYVCASDPASSGDTGFIQGCVSYQKKLNDSNQYQLNCSQCQPDRAPSVTAGFTQSCDTHDIDGCINTVYYGAQAGGPPIFFCIECSPNHVINTERCTSNPTLGELPFVTGCSRYYYKTGVAIFCYECSTDGHYPDYSDSSDKKCIDASDAIPGCVKYLTLDQCKACSSDKVLKKNEGDLSGSTCVNQPGDMPGCIEFATVDGISFTCLKCSSEYYLLNDNSGCGPVFGGSSSIANCDEFDSGTTCGDCAVGNYRNDSKTECLQCPPTECLHTSNWKGCKAVHDSDCATAGVDTSVFSDFVGPSCIKNSCLEQYTTLQNDININAPFIFSTLSFIEKIGYDPFCYEFKVHIDKSRANSIVYDVIQNTDIASYEVAVWIDIYVKFRNLDYQILQQTFQYQFSVDGVTGDINLDRAILAINTREFHSGALSSNPDLLSEGFTISRRKKADFTADADAGDILMGTEIYYRIVPEQANQPIDLSKLTVFMVSEAVGQSKEIELVDERDYTVLPHTDNEYQKLTITRLFVGLYRVKITYV